MIALEGKPANSSKRARMTNNVQETINREHSNQDNNRRLPRSQLNQVTENPSAEVSRPTPPDIVLSSAPSTSITTPIRLSSNQQNIQPSLAEPFRRIGPNILPIILPNLAPNSQIRPIAQRGEILRNPRLNVQPTIRQAMATVSNAQGPFGPLLRPRQPNSLNSVRRQATLSNGQVVNVRIIPPVQNVEISREDRPQRIAEPEDNISSVNLQLRSKNR